jgi:tetratricopeptide (TPR) repeat protein
LAYDIAIVKSQFSSEQMTVWKQVENLQMSVQQSLQSGDVQSAYTATRQLSQLKKQLFGGDSFLYGQSLVQQAALDAQVGQFDIAIDNLNDSMSIMKAHELSDHPELMAVHASLANVYLQVSKLKTAVANQKEATRIAGVVFGVQSLQMATQANQLAAFFHRAGNLPVAEDVFRRSLAIREHKLGPDHLAVAHSCLNLGVVLMDAKNLKEAHESLERAGQIFAKESGIDSAISQRCQSKLAVVAMLEQRPDKAEKILKEIIQTFARTEEPDSEVLVTYQYRLSIALGRQGKYSEAGPLMQSVLDFQQRKYGDADSRTVATMQAYAMLLDRTKNEKTAAKIRNRIRQVSHVVDDNDFQRR